MNLSQIIKDLQILTKQNVSQADIGRALNIDRSSVNIRVKRGTEVKLSDIEKIADYFRVDIGSLIDKPFVNHIPTDDYITVPVRGEVVASMGTGVEVYNETQTGTYQLGAKLLKDIGVNRNSCEMIFASGDSMMPTIEGGDSLLIDTSKTEVYDGKIYCVRIDGQLYAKRLQKIPPNKIKVVSDNSAKYDAFYIDLTKDTEFDFCVIGEIKWWGRVAR